MLVAMLMPLSGCVSEEPSELEGDWYFVDDGGLLNAEWDDDSEAFADLQFEVNGTWLFIYDSADDACGVLSRTSIDSSVWYDELEALTYPSFCPSEDEA